jgi:hypothetical protein
MVIYNEVQLPRHGFGGVFYLVPNISHASKPYDYINKKASIV